MRIWIIVGLVSSVAVVLGGCGQCDHFEEVLAKNSQGRSIVSNLDACTAAFGGSDHDEAVYLVDSSVSRSLLFRYVPNPGIVVPEEMNKPVSAKWLSAEAVRISVGAVAGIKDQKLLVNGVHVTYKIGMILKSPPAS